MFLLFFILVINVMPSKADGYKDYVNVSYEEPYSNTQCSSKKKQSCHPKSSAELSEEIKKLSESK